MFDKVRLARVLYLPELSARTWVGQLELNNSFTTCRSHPCQNDSSHHWIMVVTIYRVIFWGCPVQTITVWIIYNGRQWLRQTFEQPISYKYMFRMLRKPANVSSSTSLFKFSTESILFQWLEKSKWQLSEPRLIFLLKQQLRTDYDCCFSTVYRQYLGFYIFVPKLEHFNKSCSLF